MGPCEQLFAVQVQNTAKQRAVTQRVDYATFKQMVRQACQAHAFS